MSSPGFADLGVSKATVRALTQRGIDSPFAVQTGVIPDVLGNHDVLVKSPTGSGKTLAFGTPLVDLIRPDGPRPAALVLAPTRELASQIADEMYAIAHAKSLSVTAVYGGVGLHNQAKQASRSHILIATPGRLMDLIDRRAFSLDQIEVLVLDEADRMLDMGFKPVVDKIVAMTPSKRQTLLFSATLDGEVGRIAGQYTSDARRHDFAPAPEAKGDIEHRFMRVTHDAKVDHLVRELKAADGRTLVFVRTKRGADRLVKRLGSHSVKAVAMHGDKSQSQREKALSRFESGHIDTLVATDVAARGIDVSDITHVINFDVPMGSEDYVHRIGRTARAGATGIGITFVLDDQAKDVAKMARDLGLQRELEEGGLRPHTSVNTTRPPGHRNKPRPQRRNRR